MSTSTAILGQRAVSEGELAAHLGVDSRTLEAVRADSLVEGVDFVKKGRRVNYTENGVRHVAGALEKPREDAPGAGGGGEDVAGEVLRRNEAAGASVEAKKTATAVVECVVSNSYLRMAWRNPRLVSGTVEGAHVRVRVADAELFRPGMRIQVRMERPGMAVATRRPRARGVW